MDFHFLHTLKGYLQKIKKYLTLQKALEDIVLPGRNPQKKKTIRNMTSDEFYEHITNTDDLDIDQNVFLHYLLDYIMTGYLDGTLKDIDLKNILGLSNPFQVNRYVEKLVRNAKMQGSLLDELAKYQDSPEKADELYSLILPDYAYDPKAKQVKIKNFNDLKGIIQDSSTEMQKQKKMLAIARMQQQEKLRREEYQKAVLLNSPEISELISKDKFRSEDQEIEHDAKILYDEAQRQKKGVVLRKAVNPEKHTVISSDTSGMSPSELIAYKKQVLKKLRKDLDSSRGVSGGMNVKI